MLMAKFNDRFAGRFESKVHTFNYTSWSIQNNIKLKHSILFFTDHSKLR